MNQLLTDFISRISLQPITIPELSIANIIDILVVSYGIYKIMYWVRETRAWTLFKGFLVIIVMYAIASQLGFVTLLWVMKSTFSAGLIAVVVIFQPELRRALEQLGKGKFLKSIMNTEVKDAHLSEKSANEIIKAVLAMSKAKTGALIVIEQQVALGDLEQTGIAVDALVSSQLLINIFENKTPLHDGAVVIRNDRVAAATCILPLTSAEIASELGTRHRAAVGTSEVSDAIVIVVSEETGSISVASENKLKRHLNEDKLKSILLNSEAIAKKAVTKREWFKK